MPRSETKEFARTKARPHQTLYFEEMTPGMSKSLMKTVMDQDLHAFALVSGDDNPIHVDEDYAAKSIFGQRIAHGMFTASLISAVIGTKLPGPGAIYLSQSMNFKGAVKIGDVVHAHVEVLELLEKGSRVRLGCHCFVDDRVVLDGEAMIIAPSVKRAGKT